MIKGKYDDLEPLIGLHVCGECGAPIELAWSSEEKSYVITCGNGHYPDTLTRIMSLTQESKVTPDTPPGGNNQGKKPAVKRGAASLKEPQAVTFKGVPTTDLGTGELLPPPVIQALIDYALKYDLDPARGHVCLMYGKPYITLDGYLYHANQSGKSYKLKSRPLDNGEREMYQVEEDDHAWRADLLFNDGKSLTMGVGIVTRDEMTEVSKKRPGQLASPVVARHPWQLAQKRAEWQALRRAFPIGGEQ